MADWLMLDTLFPPTPAQLVVDMRSVGARAVGMYVFRRDGSGNPINNGGWTSAHVSAVRADGKCVLPILVPGNVPGSGDMSAAIAAAVARGTGRTAMAVDIEQFSFPAPQWLRQSIAYAHSVGWRVLRYGDVEPLKQYPVADGDWISHGLIAVRAGQVAPVPALPSGCVADQYAVSCTINGNGYDASVISSDVFTSHLGNVGGTISMGGRLNYAPWLPSRCDVVTLNRDRKAIRSWNGGGAGQLDGNANYAAVDWEHTPEDGWSLVDWSWDDLNRQVIYAEDMHGYAYVCVVDANGGYVQTWSRLPVEVAMPLESMPIVQPAPDNALRAALKGAVDSL